MPKPPPLPTGDFNLSAGKIVAAVIAIAVIAMLFSMFYQVPSDSVSVVTRFGKYTRTEQPGLQFKLPFGIEQKSIVPILRLRKAEFGFGTTDATNPYQSSDRSEWDDEQNMVTGDRNAALVRWVVQYYIQDERAYLFNVRNPDLTLRAASESVMREVVGDRTVDEVLTVGRQDIENQSLQNLQELVDRYAMGLDIKQIQLKEVDPPEPVQDSFNEVIRAQQERETTINDARQQYNSVVPKAKGQADQMIEKAEGYALQRVNEAEGDAAKFTSVFAEYQKAPEVTKRRIYLETLSEILPSMGRKIIIDDEAQQVLPLLQLNQERQPTP